MDELLIFSVSEVSFHLKQVVETQLEHLYVRGEIANYTYHSSGHMYFSIKDDRSTLRCTFFRNVNLSLDFVPENGMEVVCFGKMAIYEKGGTYNLNVLNMTISGKGDLQRRFEILKAKLSEEGLFDEAHKRPLPRYPEKIGIVTSPTGAALQDILNVLSRRFPVQVYLYPATVQGDSAPKELIAGLKHFNDLLPVDLIILTRGGGTQEDLFCFNDEALARRIFASRIPVMSAVGHEIDYTIADFVADLRAPTPSAAAEIAVPDKRDLNILLDGYESRLILYANHVISVSRETLGRAHQRLAQAHPLTYLQSQQQRLDMAAMVLVDSTRVMEKWVTQTRMLQERIASALVSGTEKIRSMLDIYLPSLSTMLKAGIRESIANATHRVDTLEAKLELLSPRNVLAKGYAIVTSHGSTIRSAKELDSGKDVTITLADGSAEATISGISTDEADA